LKNGARSRFHLYVLGRLQDGERKQDLTMLAEFENGRALQRITVRKKELDDLTNTMLELRSYVEAGYPRDYSVKNLRQLGERLFDTILRDDVRTLFISAAGKTSGFLPLELYVEDYRIAGWPWEYLFDHSKAEFVCQSFYPICRGIFTLDTRTPFEDKTGRVRILLILGVDPSDPEATPQEQEKWIEDVLRTALAEREAELEVVRIRQPQELAKILASARNRPFDILHFFGHAGFDIARDEGYISLHDSDKNSFRFYANDLGNLLAQRGLRLVFLNACETARAGKTEQPARSSVAATLLSKGIPAVIGAQFTMPDVSAHYLASMIYNALLTGAPLIEALRDGRQAMGYARDNRFFDWGIPVLYAFDPDLVLFKRAATNDWAKEFQGALRSKDVIQALAKQGAVGSPSVFASTTAAYPHPGHPKARVGLVDIDAKIGGLPELIAKANEAQNYYQLRIAYPPIPSGTFQAAKKTHGQLVMYVPLVEKYLGDFPISLKSDYVCCLTACQIDDGEYSDLLLATIGKRNDVSVVSTFGLRGYAKQAHVSYEKAVLYLCLGGLLAMDDRWDLEYHEETENCPLDFCDNLADLVGGLRHMRFDHAACRSQIVDKKQLKAIDALLALEG
jgi:CHAT domain